VPFHCCAFQPTSIQTTKEISQQYTFHNPYAIDNAIETDRKKHENFHNGIDNAIETDRKKHENFHNGI
jgi:hypothetical protein